MRCGTVSAPLWSCTLSVACFLPIPQELRGLWLAKHYLLNSDIPSVFPALQRRGCLFYNSDSCINGV